jgi:hypothetical protein
VKRLHLPVAVVRDEGGRELEVEDVEELGGEAVFGLVPTERKGGREGGRENKASMHE